MENLSIEGSWKSPYIKFNSNGELEIWGRSLPENAIEVYEPVFTWLTNYINNPKPETKVDVKLEYFNTSSSKLLFEIFRKFEELHNKGNKISVNWYYENDDTDLKEEGELFQELVKVPINMVGIEEFEFSF